MLVIERSNIRIEWIEPEGILKKTCSGFVPSDALREVYEAALTAFARRGSSKTLSDNRKLVPVSQATLDWIEKDWTPRMVHAGWRFWAILEPGSPLGAMSGRRLMKIFEKHWIEVSVFTSEEKALGWLRSRAEPRAGPARLSRH